MEEEGYPLSVEVVVFAPLPGTFTYLWPAKLGTPRVGTRLKVPFGKGVRSGVLASINRLANISASGLKPVADCLDEQPLLDASRTAWLERAGRYYLALPGELWSTALGWALQGDMRRFRCNDLKDISSDPLLSSLFPTRAAVSLKTLLKRAADQDVSSGVRHAVFSAVASGLVEEVVAELPQPLSAESLLPELHPTEAQQQAIDAIIAGGGSFNPFLLFGRTGSGKTEVYLRAAEPMIAEGGQVLVLVPEIGLTPMWLIRLKKRFSRVAIWHSAMSNAERLKVRQHLGDVDVMIGTRSALFLPLPKLSMIVMDEEHDVSFKQQDGMSYSARDMALLLAQELGIPVVLGSATPSVESWRQVQGGGCTRLDLPDRITTHASAQPEVVDMRGTDAPISATLLEAMRENLASGEQSILFLNRRGYAPALQCTACGSVPECPDCSMRLTLHRRAGQLRCHTCGYRRKVPGSCETCGEHAFLPLGEGLEKLEEWLVEQLPELHFERFDRDVITSHSRLEKTLADFGEGRIDCLIGTQMLVKGHDFPNVTLVGIVNADLGVSLPDFRAGERWWQQMTQVTGRAGRSDKPGRVIIQTRMPEADWLARISEDEAVRTLDEELKLREMLHYPPYARWVRLVFSSAKVERANEVAGQFMQHCRGFDGVDITGPMPCPLERISGKYRIEVLLRDVSRKLLPWKLAPLISSMQLPRDVRIRVDVDPHDMM